MTDLPPLDPFQRVHIGKCGAFTHRTNPTHVALARAAVAHRLDVAVGEIVIDWPWKRPAEVVSLSARRRVGHG